MPNFICDTLHIIWAILYKTKIAVTKRSNLNEKETRLKNGYHRFRPQIQSNLIQMVNLFNFKNLQNHDFSLNFSCNTKYVGGKFGTTKANLVIFNRK